MTKIFDRPNAACVAALCLVIFSLFITHELFSQDQEFPANADGAQGDAVLLVRETEGLAARRLEGIRTVKVSPNGRIVVVHRDGVAALDLELIPESFLRGWKISPDEVRNQTERIREERMMQLEVRPAALRDSFPWMWQPPPTWGERRTKNYLGAIEVNSLPWTDKDEKVLEGLLQKNLKLSSINVREMDWWQSEGETRETRRAISGAILIQDSRFDVVTLPSPQQPIVQENDPWLEEALPRAEGFEVWRDVWSEFPLVRIRDLYSQPDEYQDRMVRVRGRFGNVNWSGGLEFFDISEGGENFRVVFTSLLQAAAMERGLEERMKSLRALPGNFSREITVVGEVGVEQDKRVFLDLIDFTF